MMIIQDGDRGDDLGGCVNKKQTNNVGCVACLSPVGV